MIIIAEAGVNHNGNPDLAFELVRVSAKAGADVVKFQTFRTEKLVTSQARQANYQKRNLGVSDDQTQSDMLRKLELDYRVFFELKAECDSCGIRFLSTPFDVGSALFLIDELGESLLKIGSGDFDNLPLLISIARRGAKVILSSGMTALGDIEMSLGALAFGYLADVDDKPSLSAFQAAYASAEARHILKEKVTILHCTTEYPAPPESLNLNAITTIARSFGLDVGFSDHSEGPEAAIAARVLGATVLEKHITLDRSMPGPDHKASMEPTDFAAMVRQIRNLDAALGDGIKRMMIAEGANKAIARKSPVAAAPIRAGELFSEENMTLKRTRGGAPAIRYYDLLGQPSSHSFDVDEAIL
ncbi:N-acetylneuraminate synthase [Ciceribacter lividus]|uniref:N-acetylneuraminate synthase n=1 Tax=Ciceribacter lividus TaxID=1197950 RepID=A0A6I7HJJ8_9HYPH|nr:N-acetylneuraminate synthase [Ciceribacter lividus]RCW21171.1 N-acetylneuraminate synthase [Ciceribacter lividus]